MKTIDIIVERVAVPDWYQRDCKCNSCLSLSKRIDATFENVKRKVLENIG